MLNGQTSVHPPHDYGTHVHVPGPGGRIARRHHPDRPRRRPRPPPHADGDEGRHGADLPDFDGSTRDPYADRGSCRTTGASAVRLERARQGRAGNAVQPENGVFQPGTRFRTFAFTETGDTDIQTEVGAVGGGFGAVQMLDQRSPSTATGKLHLLLHGDAEHAAFDNVSWLSVRTGAAVEDRGDTFHSQGNGVQPTALDTGWAIDATVDHAKTTA